MTYIQNLAHFNSNSAARLRLGHLTNRRVQKPNPPKHENHLTSQNTSGRQLHSHPLTGRTTDLNPRVLLSMVRQPRRPGGANSQHRSQHTNQPQLGQVKQLMAMFEQKQ